MTQKKKATTELLEDLHGKVAASLLQKIEEGTATAADLAVARQFLKDNGIDAIPRGTQGVSEGLQALLPFPDTAGVDEETRLN